MKKRRQKVEGGKQEYGNSYRPSKCSKTWPAIYVGKLYPEVTMTWY